MRRPSDTPTAQERQALVTALQQRGIPAAWVSSIVAAGRSRREMTDALIARLRTAPKARG